MSLTLPSVSFLMNLYSKDVPAGTLTETVHTGYEAEDSAICEGTASVRRAGRHVLHMSPTASSVSQFPSCAMLPTRKMF